MGAQKELYIKQMNDAREEAYKKIEVGIRDLLSLGVPENEMVLIVYNICECMIEEKGGKKEK